MATFSLASAGIGYRPPFVRAETIGDAPFYIVYAEVNPNGYGGQPELYAVLDMIPTDDHQPVAYDDDGQPVNRVAWTAKLTASREDIVRFFRAHPGDQLGPCMFMFVPSQQGGKPFAQLTDYSPISGAIAAPAPQRQLQQRQPQQPAQRPQQPAQRPQQTAYRSQQAAAPSRHPIGPDTSFEDVDDGLPF